MLLDYYNKEFLDIIEYIYFTIIYFKYNYQESKTSKFDRYLLKNTQHEPENIRNKYIKLLKCFKGNKAYLQTLPDI